MFLDVDAMGAFDYDTQTDFVNPDSDDYRKAILK